jgi:hypothetical protein
MGREAVYRNALSQPRMTSKDAGTETLAAMSLWLDRTRLQHRGKMTVAGDSSRGSGQRDLE